LPGAAGSPLQVSGEGKPQWPKAIAEGSRPENRERVAAGPKGSGLLRRGLERRAEVVAPPWNFPPTKDAFPSR